MFPKYRKENRQMKKRHGFSIYRRTISRSSSRWMVLFIYYRLPLSQIGEACDVDADTHSNVSVTFLHPRNGCCFTFYCNRLDAIVIEINTWMVHYCELFCFHSSDMHHSTMIQNVQISKCLLGLVEFGLVFKCFKYLLMITGLTLAKKIDFQKFKEQNVN